MRDVALTLIFIVLLLRVFRTPAVGAYLWAWLGMMNPHKLTWGFAFSLPFAQVTAIATVLSMAFSRERKPFPVNAITVLQVLLLVWMTVTSVFALNTPDLVWPRWFFVVKIQFMLFVTWMLLRGRQQIEILVWVMTLSIGFYGIKGGLWTLATGGGGRVWGPPGGFIMDNNSLAVALVMTVPFYVYLFQVNKRRIVRWALGGATITTAFAILGSQSRGALLSIVAMATLMALRGKHKLYAGIALGVLVIGGISFMPESWVKRMETIQNYEQESSALSRLYTWNTLWNAAKDRPVVGVGFRADDISVFRRYAPTGHPWTMFIDAVWVAHSIYFQMLGEHGFVGLGLFLLLFGWAWFRAGALARQTRDDPEFGTWVPLLMPMVQVSLVGYLVGGAFLSLAYFDMPYYIITFVILVDATLRERQRAPALSPARGLSGPAPAAQPKEQTT